MKKTELLKFMDKEQLIKVSHFFVFQHIYMFLGSSFIYLSRNHY